MRTTRIRLGRLAPAALLLGLLLAGVPVQAAKAPKTAAYVHVASSASSCPLDIQFNVLDHPLINGNPDAIVIVGINEGPSSGFGGFTAGGPVSVFYDDAGLCATDRWVVITGTGIPLGQRFNVFVAAP